MMTITIVDKIVCIVSVVLTVYTGLDPYWGLYTAAPFHCAAIPLVWFFIRMLWACR